MTKMAVMPIYGINHSKIFSETWYVAFVTPAHHCLLKLCPWDDLDLFYGKVNFGNIGFYMTKNKNNEFFRNGCSMSPGSGRCRQPMELMKV